MPISLRTEFDAGQLRAAARQTKEAAQARRLLALAAIYDGASRGEAARIGGVRLQIVRDWVLRCHASGPAGLVDRKAPGQAARLNEAHRTALQRRWRAVRSRPSMGWCAVGWSTSASGCGRNTGSRWPSRP
ncbi:transposase [Dankookia sp. GCM10030260]|uniref:helix-turn-helix domain-containing protein n=1 Tax=Dankookia sp. GCM10030260 TaxID=3273390 RepID=UPI003623991E